MTKKKEEKYTNIGRFFEDCLNNKVAPYLRNLLDGTEYQLGEEANKPQVIRPMLDSNDKCYFIIFKKYKTASFRISKLAYDMIDGQDINISELSIIQLSDELEILNNVIETFLFDTNVFGINSDKQDKLEALYGAIQRYNKYISLYRKDVLNKRTILGIASDEEE